MRWPAATGPLAAAAIIAAIGGSGCCGCGGGTAGRERDEASADRPVVRLRLDALDGGEVDTARYRGRVVVLHLFETDVTAAITDADQLSELARREPRRVMVIGVALDREGYDMVAPWRKGAEADYLIALGDPSIAAGATPLGAVRVLPTTVILDRWGGVARRIERPLRRGELAATVRPLLP